MKFFADHLRLLLEQILYETMCIVGDFNEDTLLAETKPCCGMLKSLNYRQVVDKPTCDSGTFIDHIYVNSHVAVETDVADCYYSDHDFVLCTVNYICNNDK